MNTFTETQQFRQWWVWLVLGICFAAAIVVLAKAPAPAGLITTAPLLLVFALMWFWRLDTRYDTEGVHYRVFPLIGWRTIRWVDMATSTVTTYGFVGYGIRWNFGEWVYNVAGNQGLRIKTTTGKRILIGTQRPDELRAFLQHLAVLTD